MTIPDINQLFYERIGLIDDYMKLRKQLDAHLSIANISISKAKTTRGISLFSVNSIGTYELEPTVLIECQDSKFLLNSKEVEEENNGNEIKHRKSGKCEDVPCSDKEQKENPPKNQFRPFGILEPTSAKDARKEMKESIDLICRLATIQRQIQNIDEKLKDSYNDLIKQEDVVNSLKNMVI